MNCLLVEWIHVFPLEPVCIYREMNSDRWETRKVEIYVDRRMGVLRWNQFGRWIDVEYGTIAFISGNRH
ncbi:DUF6881 domain-containing protein [Ralstonia solanacearum]|uniref:DUF6881 domain-containing protein n=1 Tax=Ralstonia solanacearum TaxID=305 RepID=UPI00399D6CB3